MGHRMARRSAAPNWCRCRSKSPSRSSGTCSGRATTRPLPSSLGSSTRLRRGQAQELLVLEIVANEMSLDVENKLSSQTLRPRQHQLRLVRLGRFDLEYVAIDFVHGEEGCSHAAARLHKLPSTEANPLAADVGQLQHPAFDALLCLTLRRREVFSIGHDLCRYGGCGRNRFSTGH